MRIVLQQVDLDTCLTGLLRGAGAADDVSVRRDGATPTELDDPEVLCIEAGGSGRTDRNNFDHHDPGGSWPPACVQAFQAAGSRGSDTLRRLVDYVADVDLGRGRRADEGHLDLSGLFSGLRLAVVDPKRQFFEGVAMLRTVLDDNLDPCGPLPARPEWTSLPGGQGAGAGVAAGGGADGGAFRDPPGPARPGCSRPIGVGALGALYALGCEIGIAFAPAFRPPAGGEPIRKFTIAGRDGLRVDGLLASLSEREAGWGGPAHGTIIASPRGGTRLGSEEVRRLVCEHL